MSDDDVYELTWEGKAQSVTIQAAVYSIKSIVFTIEESAVNDISTATVTLNADKTVASLNNGKSDNSHTAITVPTELGEYYAYVTPQSNNTAYTGTAKSDAFVVATDLSTA